MTLVSSNLNLEEIALNSQESKAENSLSLIRPTWSNFKAQHRKVNIRHIGNLKLHIGAWPCVCVSSQACELINWLPMMTDGSGLSKGV